MLSFIFIGSSIALVLIVYVVLVHRAKMVRAGSVSEFYGENGGLTEVYIDVYKHYRQTVKAIVVLKKLAFQYIFHILVRVLFYVKKWTNSAYAFARNQFVRNAVKSKSSVSFFWSHLKEYKKQIETEEKKEK